MAVLLLKVFKKNNYIRLKKRGNPIIRSFSLNVILISKINLLFVKIGKIENVLPPAKCTLTDLHKGHTYNFSVRITDDEDCMSDFSEPVTAIL